MKFFSPVLLMFLLSMFVHNSIAQTANEILDKYFSVIDPFSKSSTIKTRFYEGKRQLDGNEQAIKITIADGLWREDMLGNGNRKFTLLTKEGGWEYDETGIKKLKKIKKSSVGKYEDAANIESSLDNYKQPNFQATLLGKDSADGRQCFKLKIKEVNRKEVFVWFDTATFLKIQSQVPSIAGFNKPFNRIKDVEVNVVTVFRDYKNVNGLLLPFTCLINAYDIHTNEQVRKVSTYFTNIEINKPIDPKYYKPATN